MSAPIVGPRTYEQLEDLLGTVDVDAERGGARAAGRRIPRRPESYPRRMLVEQSGIRDVESLRR